MTMPVLDVDGTSRGIFSVSVGNNKIDIRSSGGIFEIRNTDGAWRPLQSQLYLKTAAPIVTDDVSAGYLVTDLWYYAESLYVCRDNTIGAAVWTQVAGGGGGTSDHTLLTNRDAINQHPISAITGLATALAATAKLYMKTANPAVTDDSSAGYLVGDIWYYATQTWICSSNTIGAAVWRLISGKHIQTTTSPTTAEGQTAGYAIGDLWVNTTTAQMYICTSPTDGAAVWYLITKISAITTDVVKYISKTGSDSNNGDVATPWLTFAAFLSWIADKQVTASGSLTCQFGDGIFTTPFFIWQRGDAKPIILTGTTTQTVTVNSIASVSGSSQAWSYVLNVNNASLATIGDFIVIRSASGGTYPELLRGTHKITGVNVGAGQITVLSQSETTLTPSGAVTYSQAQIIKTVLQSTATGAGSGMLFLTPLSMKSMAVEYSGTGSAIMVTGPFGALDFVAGGSLATCVYASGAGCTGVSVTNRSYFYCGNGHIGVSAKGYCVNLTSGSFMSGSSLQLNGIFGLFVDNSVVDMPFGLSFSGGGTGVYARNNARVNLGSGSSIFISRCTSYGYYAASGSYIKANSGQLQYCTYGVTASSGSYVEVYGTTLVGNGSNSNPAFQTVGNYNAYVYA